MANEFPRDPRIPVVCGAVLSVVAGLFILGGVQAQHPGIASLGKPLGRVRTLVVETNVPSALVFVDSVLVGRASEHAFTVDRSARKVRLTPPNLDAWSVPPVHSPIPVAMADTVVVTMPFPYYYNVNSSPYGAAVRVLGDSVRIVGHTPLTFSLSEPAESGIAIQLAGFAEEEWYPETTLWSTRYFDLVPLGGVAANNVVLTQRRRRRWIDAMAIGIAGASAAVGIHYKFKADRRYEAYEQSGDPSLRPEIRRLDIRSGIAVGAMQVALGVVVVRMIID